MQSKTHAGVAELADALDLGSSVNRCAGSSPVTRTKEKVGNIVLPTLFLYGTKLGQDLKATVKKTVLWTVCRESVDDNLAMHEPHWRG